jgi:hypothetical protein
MAPLRTGLTTLMIGDVQRAHTRVEDALDLALRPD